MPICQKCETERANAGPFRDDKTGEKWERVCGGCKFRITFADPERKARFQRELEATARAALTAPILPKGEA